MTEFEWVLYKDQYVVFSSDYVEEPEYINYIKKKAYKMQDEKILGNNETCYYIRDGNVWVGSM